MLILNLIGIGLALWVSLGYGYAFFKTAIRWFLLHSLRWLIIGQYLWLLGYLLAVGVWPMTNPELVLLGVIGLILLRKIGPMLRNRYTEAGYKARDILLLRIVRPVNQQPGLAVPFNHRVDVGANRPLLLNLIVYGLLAGLNCAIIYGTILIRP